MIFDVGYSLLYGELVNMGGRPCIVQHARVFTSEIRFILTCPGHIIKKAGHK